nr:immunoglobulin heavy chain junction region [Macaca mulatta]
CARTGGYYDGNSYSNWFDVW